MVDCDDLQQVETGTMGEALTLIVGTSEKYAECRAKVNSWIEIGKKLEANK